MSEKERLSILDLTVSVIAAAAHDVGHPGVNNDFLKMTSSDLALRYNDQSVLEHFHAATCFEVLRDHLDHNWLSLLKQEFQETPEASDDRIEVWGEDIV